MSLHVTGGIKVPATLVAGILAVLLVLHQFLVIPGRSGLELALNNALHIPLFFTITSLVWLLLAEHLRAPVTRLKVTAVVSVALALITEAVQYFTPRDATIGDVFLNLTGITSAMLALLSLQLRSRRSLFLVSTVLATLVFLAGFSRVADFVWLYKQRREIAPLIVDIDGPDKLLNASLLGDWEKVADVNWPGVKPPGIVARFRLRSDIIFPGITINEPLPDWNSYSVLVVETFLENDDPIPVTLRVETQRDRGINSTVESFIESGDRRLSVPISSLIPYESGKFPLVKELLIYSSHLSRDREFYLMDIHLE